MQQIIANTKHNPTTNAERDCCKTHLAAEQNPYFDNFALFSLFINDKKPMTWVMVEVLANDSNCGVGATSRVRYSLQQTSKGAKTFRVDEKLGTLCLTAKLDYETTTRYQLTVEANDPSKF
uniref:CA domain-containing protein n=1 Tax=Steinernema glaseri TaxID=37863 RepID=A0A1I7ZG91_9BILA